MQHLPFLPQKEIPYLGGPAYAGEGLRAFVKRHGWTPVSLRKINFRDRSPGSKFAFIQSLFNIAIVIEFLQIRHVQVTHKMFCRNDSVLDTSVLPSLMDAMAKNEEPNHPKRRLSKQEQAFRAHEIFGFIDSCTAHDIHRNMEDETLSMLCMIYTLAELAGLQDFLGLLPPGSNHMTLRGPFTQHLQPVENLLHAGWCPRQVAELHSLTGPISLYYITTLTRNHKFGNHTSCTKANAMSHSSTRRHTVQVTRAPAPDVLTFRLTSQKSPNS